MTEALAIKMASPLRYVLSNFVSRINTPRVPCRFYSPSVKAKKLVINEFGDPIKVVKLEEEDLRDPGPDEVLVQMLVASVNPADINTVQGVYPVKPKLPGVPGNEGVGRIVAVGSNVTTVREGDTVIPNIESMGTWRTHGVFKETAVLKVRDDVPLVELAGISSNTSTAFRMLKDFVDLKEGDIVIQNGANSAAGQNVIQFCKAFGFKSVNIVRDRPDISDLKGYLSKLGADFVLTEEELRKTELFKSGAIAAPRLGLNCVGGKSGTELIRKLGPAGVMVTYGGVSREPVIIPTAVFIFKDVTARGFWMTRWTKENRNSNARRKMFDDIMELMKQKKLVAPAHKLLPLSMFSEALANTINPKGFAGIKYLFDFSFCSIAN